jgi:hypothetical protein
VSHIVSIQTQVRDPVAIAAACRRLGLAEPVQQTVKLFTNTVTGLAVQLPGWRYPIVCDITSGTVKYDNYLGQWGKQAELLKFLQGYAVAMATIEARKKGHTVTEQSLADGSIKLTIPVAGGAT